MAFQGLLYAASYDHLDVPLVPRDNVSMVSLSVELLEEVKDVLIPADMLRIEDSQIIGKGKNPAILFCLLVFVFHRRYNIPLIQATLGRCIMAT